MLLISLVHCLHLLRLTFWNKWVIWSTTLLGPFRLQLTILLQFLACIHANTKSIVAVYMAPNMVSGYCIIYSFIYYNIFAFSLTTFLTKSCLVYQSWPSIRETAAVFLFVHYPCLVRPLQWMLISFFLSIFDIEGKTVSFIYKIRRSVNKKIMSSATLWLSSGYFSKASKFEECLPYGPTWDFWSKTKKNTFKTTIFKIVIF